MFIEYVSVVLSIYIFLDYTGDRCEVTLVDDVDCSNDRCQNGGICQYDDNDRIRCECIDRRYGGQLYAIHFRSTDLVLMLQL